MGFPALPYVSAKWAATTTASPMCTGKRCSHTANTFPSAFAPPGNRPHCFHTQEHSFRPRIHILNYLPLPNALYYSFSDPAAGQVLDPLCSLFDLGPCAKLLAAVALLRLLQVRARLQ